MTGYSRSRTELNVAIIGAMAAGYSTMDHDDAVTEIMTFESFHAKLGSLILPLIRPRAVMVLIYSSGCPACEGMKMLQKLLAKSPYQKQMDFYLVRHDRLKEWEPKLEIELVPTSLFLDDVGGNKTLVGTSKKSLKKHLDHLYFVNERLFSKAFHSIFP